MLAQIILSLMDNLEAWYIVPSPKLLSCCNPNMIYVWPLGSAYICLLAFADSSMH